MTAPMPLYPAFKEWQVIVDALAAGDQSLLLRKGGIAEGRGGFDPKRADRFWLFPTEFHAQREKTKPKLASCCNAPRAVKAMSEKPAATVTLSAFAEVVELRFITDWPTVAELDSFHCWTEDAVREKFQWGSPPGLHALVVRVYRLDRSVTLVRSAAMAGCKSWLELQVGFDDLASSLVEPKRAVPKVVAALRG